MKARIIKSLKVAILSSLILTIITVGLLIGFPCALRAWIGIFLSYGLIIFVAVRYNGYEMATGNYSTDESAKLLLKIGLAIMLGFAFSFLATMFGMVLASELTGVIIAVVFTIIFFVVIFSISEEVSIKRWVSSLPLVSLTYVMSGVLTTQMLYWSTQRQLYFFFHKVATTDVIFFAIFLAGGSIIIFFLIRYIYLGGKWLGVNLKWLRLLYHWSTK